MPRKAVSKDTTSKFISIMNEAMPMKLVSKDTTDQAVPMMDVSKDTTNQAMSKMIVKLNNYKAQRRPPLVPSQRVPMRSQDHHCYTLVLIIKQKYLTK